MAVKTKMPAKPNWEDNLMSSKIIPHSIFKQKEGSASSGLASGLPEKLRGNQKEKIKEKMTGKLDVHTQRILWLTVGFGAIAVICGFCLTQFDTPLTDRAASPIAGMTLVATIISGTIAGLLGVLLPFIGHANRKHEKQIEEMRAGNYLVRWDLDRDQWLAFIEDEKEKATELVSTSAVVCTVIALLVGIPLWSVLGPLGYVAIVVGACAAGYLFGKLLTFCRRRNLENWNHETFFTVIGYDGLFFNNAFYPYSVFGSGLESVEKMETESMTYLTFTFFNQTNDGKNEYQRRVPVPRGKEEEAQMILKCFE